MLLELATLKIRGLEKLWPSCVKTLNDFGFHEVEQLKNLSEAQIEKMFPEKSQLVIVAALTAWINEEKTRGLIYLQSY